MNWQVKMMMTDARTLKSKHRLELVMQEFGDQFEPQGERWLSKSKPGLIVDIRRQIYEYESPGAAKVTGDLYDWLKRRFGWSFRQALLYLQKRTPDPVNHEMSQPVNDQAQTQNRRQDESLEMLPVDLWQEKALLVGGERMRKYFSWSFEDLILIPETRIEPTHAPQISHCPRCGERIGWCTEKDLLQTIDGWGNAVWKRQHGSSIPIVAYSIKQRIDSLDWGLDGSDELKSLLADAKVSATLQEKISRVIFNSYENLIDQITNLFIEEDDGLVCVTCAWNEYDFQVALSLCKKSAKIRWETQNDSIV